MTMISSISSMMMCYIIRSIRILIICVKTSKVRCCVWYFFKFYLCEPFKSFSLSHLNASLTLIFGSTHLIGWANVWVWMCADVCVREDEMRRVERETEREPTTKPVKQESKKKSVDSCHWWMVHDVNVNICVLPNCCQTVVLLRVSTRTRTVPYRTVAVWDRWI